MRQSSTDEYCFGAARGKHAPWMGDCPSSILASVGVMGNVTVEGEKEALLLGRMEAAGGEGVWSGD